jgi:hypothetical protein
MRIMRDSYKTRRRWHPRSAVWVCIESRLRRMRFALLGLVFLISINARAQLKANASQVQAAYLYNFGKFVKWPASALANQSGSFTICVLDEDPFGATLQSTLVGQTVDGKPVVVKHLTKTQDAAVCHILFIDAAQGKDLSSILAALDESAVLTVSDMPDFSRRGGMIQFVLQGGRIRFEINLEGAERSHLVFASELLKVAAAVTKTAGAGD